MIDPAGWLGHPGLLEWSVVQSLRQFQPLLATLGDAMSDCSHNAFCLAIREVLRGAHASSIRRARWMSISVISSGFIGIPYSITCQRAKQDSVAATIKLTHYPRAGCRSV
jgi:hypothetical protein